MGLSIIKALPTADDIAQRYPVTSDHRIEERRQAVNAILAGTDSRLLMITGPCSAWPSEAVEAYAEKLAQLQDDVHEKLLLVLRTYIQKPRTTVGWPGPLNQPDPLGNIDIARGIEECRRLMCSVGTMLPLADEMLFTHNANHFEPLLSYIAVGARSSEDMEHRYLASGLDCAVGIKNGTSGDIKTGVNGVLCAQKPHQFAYNGNQVETSGNPYAHLVLRGGGGRSNYDAQSLALASRLLDEAKIVNPSIIVDASHDNSINGHGKDPELQAIVVENVLTGIRRNREEYRRVKGFMLESFIHSGSQKIPAASQPEQLRRDGLSITDPCLGWEQTRELILETAEALSL